MQLSTDLKERTKDIHKRTEKTMILWLKKIRSPEDYAELLNWLYAYYGPLEDKIRTQLTADNFPDITKRCRADALLQDMEAMGIPLPRPVICHDLPVIDTYGKALGALYVLEVGTLEGRIIAGMMARQPGLEKSLSYFHSYGNETAGMWQSFKDHLDNPKTLAHKEEIFYSAGATFSTFKTWIEQHALPVARHI